ncbi:MAG TPA: hypothetical protein VMM36_12310 [Opitutaceae bacterium]|nr:hypothetical protein [Opitutaceae bacterium]
MISSTDLFSSSGDPMPNSSANHRSSRLNRLKAARQPRNRRDYVTFGRALLENPLYPDARVIEELAGVMSRRVFSDLRGS